MDKGIETTVGLRELRQRASEIVRQVEEGHEMTVTVQGRPAVRLVPITRSRWRRLADVREAFGGAPVDAAAWRADMEQIDESIRDRDDRP
ncbi:MAG TPA: type II toxin-antitoxin system prevent-host-death family antitoxin [Acidimicrobiales bacterium]|jgi:prevent-host-death family protein